MNDPRAVALDTTLLDQVVAAIHAAGDELLRTYSEESRPSDRDDLLAAGSDNEARSLEILRPALEAIRPGARWLDDDFETQPLPPGEWWVVDAVEGNVNLVHGLPEWAVSVALVDEAGPVLAAVYQPVGRLTHTGRRGGGAYRNGRRLQTSGKVDLAWSIATTAQAEAGQQETYHRIATSIEAMLGSALLVRATVPSTFPLLMVAGGHAEIFWQYEPVLPGVAAGALLVAEAGGVVTDARGNPWRPGARDVLIGAPGVHAQALEVLSAVAAA